MQLGIRNVKFEIDDALTFHIPNYKFHIALAACADISELNHGGIYLLVGERLER